MNEEWFRSPRWGECARADFEQRLSRARPYSRQQYLRIKTLAPREAGLIEPARSLLLRVMEQYPQDPEQASATELLGDLAREQDDSGQAESHYRRLLRDWPDLNNTSGMVEVSLAELLTDRGDGPARTEALRLLETGSTAVPRCLTASCFAGTLRWSASPCSWATPKPSNAPPAPL